MPHSHVTIRLLCRYAIASWTGAERALRLVLVEVGQLVVVDLWRLLNHELDERGHLILDDVETGIRPEETGGKADGEVDGVHAVGAVLLGNVVQEREQVVEEELVLTRQLLQNPVEGVSE